MKAVILAGGLGTRLSEETDRIPKPMINIGGRPILWHIMKMYSAHGINQFVICLGYKGYLIKEYFFNYRLHMSDFTLDLSTDSLQIHQHSVEPWNVTLIDTGEDTQTGGRLRRVRDQLEDDTFCFTYGDGVANIDINALIAFATPSSRCTSSSFCTSASSVNLFRISFSRLPSCGASTVINKALQPPFSSFSTYSFERDRSALTYN